MGSLALTRQCNRDRRYFPEIVYLYSNPAKANLVSSIARYPEGSSWDTYSRVTPTLNARVEGAYPFVRKGHIKAIDAKTSQAYEDELRA
jgi:hypothetical protein